MHSVRCTEKPLSPGVMLSIALSGTAKRALEGDVKRPSTYQSRLAEPKSVIDKIIPGTKGSSVGSTSSKINSALPSLPW